MKNIETAFSTLDELCSPRVLSEVNNHYVKVAKVKGKLPLHKHKSDELFIIQKGEMIIEVEGEFFDLKEGDVFLVQKGKLHRPIAQNECHCILVEQKDLLHTGEEVFDITKSIEDQLKWIKQPKVMKMNVPLEEDYE